MASLTPGVLSKLLENVGSRVAGEHRSVLLQVIGILPALAAGDDPWSSRGFFLRVSDSVHSAYVSVSEDDAELIQADKIQLGQFIHVAWLDSAQPLPVLRGVKVVARRRPCVGQPKDLISSELLSSRRVADSSRVPKKGAKTVKPKPKLPKLACGEVKPRRLSMESGLEPRRLSLDSARRGWDRNFQSNNSSFVPKSRLKSKVSSPSVPSDSSSVVSTRKVSSEKGSATKPPHLSNSPLKIKNENFPQKSMIKPSGEGLKPSTGGALPSHLVKVPLSFKTWSNRKVPCNLLPPVIHDLGKEAMVHRNLSFLAAVHAVEESSAAERVIQCMSMFADLCQSSQKDPAGKLAEKFLNLHQDMLKSAACLETLHNTRLQEAKSSSCSQEISETVANKNALNWVLAAVESDLSKFHLLRKEEKMEPLNGEKCNFIILENTLKMLDPENLLRQGKQSPKEPSPSRKQSLSALTTKKTERVEWSKGSGLKEATSLAQKLISYSQEWFLKYLEDSLKKGFGLRKGEPGPEIAGLLGQLKRVNQWLDGLAMDQSEISEKIEGLKKKLYGFLLEHVDSTIR